MQRLKVVVGFIMLALLGFIAFHAGVVILALAFVTLTKMPLWVSVAGTIVVMSYILLFMMESRK
jgi:hypothetical protein